MAWCPHCKHDRPIQRQIFAGRCEYCRRKADREHMPDCRGPVAGALDVCSFCNTPVFCLAKNRDEHDAFTATEEKNCVEPPAAKVPCSYCKTLILLSTASKHGGLCAACVKPNFRGCGGCIASSLKLVLYTLLALLAVSVVTILAASAFA